MAWPPPVLAINRTDATPQGPGTHANDHNALALAINDTVVAVQALNAQGYKGNFYTATQHPGIAQAQVNLNGMRVDWVIEASHAYLIISTCTYNVDAGGIIVQRNIAGHGTFGVAQLTIQPGSWGTINNIALLTGPAGPNFVQVTAQVSAGFTTANDRSLMIFDLT